MVRAIMHGCNGHMGQVITGLIKDDPEIEIVAGVDPVDCRDNGYPVFPSIDKCTVEADVIIDFTSAKAVDGLIAYSAEKKVPVVYYRFKRGAVKEPGGSQQSGGSPSFRQHVPWYQHAHEDSSGCSKDSCTGRI